VTLHRFFVAPDEARGDRFALPVSIRRQVQRILRLRDGERIVLLTGDGTEALCRLEGDACVVESRSPCSGEPSHRLVVVQALLKGDGLEEVVQRGTELGAAEFRLTVSERCVVRELSPRKLERLRIVARESAEQSERGIVPPVMDVEPLDAHLSPGAVLLYERSGGARLGRLTAPGTVIIGPEGGFTSTEVERAREAGVVIAGLGPRILRSPTVAPAAAAVILSRTGDFA
jgi:16S rRNA (uracil1498-N3)-methyltransferase